MPDAFTIPGGRDKGKALRDASPESVTWWANKIAENLENGTSRNPSYDARLLTALRGAQAVGGAAKRPSHARTATRPAASSTASAAAPPASDRLATRDVATLAPMQGTFHAPREILDMLAQAATLGHLVTPQTSCGELPVGCAIATSIVWVDAATETYGIPHKDADKRGLDKTALTRIGNAAGISWDPVLSCRLDDGSHPHYVHYRSVGFVRNFDGSPRTEKGEVEIDLREGSEAAVASSEKELPIARKFILRHAESKSMNRAIRRLGVRTSYSREELAKPFIIARVMFTGRTEDPELKRMFAEKTFEAFHNARPALYGGPPPAAHALPPSAAHHDAPDNEPDYPQGDDYEGDDYDPDYVEEGEHVVDPAAAAATNTPATTAQPAAQQELKT